MEFNYDFVRKSKHKIENIQKILEKDCLNKVLGNKSNDFEYVNGEKIKTNSKRLQLYFLKNFTCECCGHRGEFFALEHNIGKNNYFLNLYTIIDGQEVLMLKELKVPGKLGGADVPDNWMLVCDKCYLEKIKQAKREKINSGDYSQGYVVQLGENYLNLNGEVLKDYSVEYVKDKKDAKSYMNKEELKIKIQKMINSKILPESGIRDYKISLKS